MGSTTSPLLILANSSTNVRGASPRPARTGSRLGQEFGAQAVVAKKSAAVSRCVTTPDKAQRVLLDRMGLTLPQRLRYMKTRCKCALHLSNLGYDYYNVGKGIRNHSLRGHQRTRKFTRTPHQSPHRSARECPRGFVLTAPPASVLTNSQALELTRMTSSGATTVPRERSRRKNHWPSTRWLKHLHKPDSARRNAES